MRRQVLDEKTGRKMDWQIKRRKKQKKTGRVPGSR